MLDLSLVLGAPRRTDEPRVRTVARNERRGLQVLDERILEEAYQTVANGAPFSGEYDIRNHNLSVGTRLAGALAERFGDAGLPTGTMQLSFNGSAGQSFGAFALRGMRLTLEGECNDYVGKGLNGAEITVRPFRNARYRGASHLNMILGNTVLYGATGGRAFFAGMGGERFAVRNSGATAVVEGVGDHGCEYMTGGTVVVLGAVGRNFAAGMSGGVVYVLEPHEIRVGDLLLEPLEAEDVRVLEGLLREHATRANSARAEQLLADFAADGARWALQFRKIWSPEYKKVMQAKEAAHG